MDAFHRRISLDEAATIVERALHWEPFHGDKSAIFHDLGLMRARIATLREAFPSESLHTIAIKANPVVEIIREAVVAGAGLEAASMEEVELARAAGAASDQIVFDSPAKTPDEIRQALAWGIYLNADSFEELERITEAKENLYSTSRVGLRVNPLVGGGSIVETSVADDKSKFGVSLDAARPRIVEAFAKHAWLSGLHVHVGSQGCDLELLAAAVGRIAGLRREIVAETGRAVPHVDIGGGLPTTYQSSQTPPTPAEYRQLLERRAPELFAADVSLITEFGRAIQANCGIAASRVEYVKPAQRLAVIHLGADFLLRPVYRPENWQHEFFVLDRDGRPKTGAPQPLTIAGPLCFAGDILARDILLPPVEPGDWIVIRDVGAYTLSMWSRHCSRGIPAVVGVDSDRSEALRMLRPQETPADLVRFWNSSHGNTRS